MPIFDKGKCLIKKILSFIDNSGYILSIISLNVNWVNFPPVFIKYSNKCP